MRMSANPSGRHPLRVLFIFEFARPEDDWMMSSLIKSIKAARPGMNPTYIHGLFGTYRPGGLNPARLANLAWVYLQTALIVPFGRFDVVLVRSTPPGIQIWTAWCACLRRLPILCWLMDYHPEIEARILERRGFGPLARLLRRIDEASMTRFSAVVVLDRAMARIARTRAGSVTVLEHPTWGAMEASAASRLDYAPGQGTGPMRLAYSGNLGTAHDLGAFRALLVALLTRRPVELYVVGASAEGNGRLGDIGSSLGIPVKAHPRVPFAQLRPLYEEWCIDAGVVLMSDQTAGLLSPSKFSGYIDFGLPILYIGPSETNADDVCTKFNGGFRLSCNPRAEELSAVTAALLDPDRMRSASQGARAASVHFSGLNNDSLAALLSPWLKERTNR